MKWLLEHRPGQQKTATPAVTQARERLEQLAEERVRKNSAIRDRANSWLEPR
jgi:hypothetical protein